MEREPTVKRRGARRVKGGGSCPAFDGSRYRVLAKAPKADAEWSLETLEAARHLK